MERKKGANFLKCMLVWRLATISYLWLYSPWEYLDEMNSPFSRTLDANLWTQLGAPVSPLRTVEDCHGCTCAMGKSATILGFSDRICHAFRAFLFNLIVLLFCCTCFIFLYVWLYTCALTLVIALVSFFSLLVFHLLCFVLLVPV